MKIRNVVLAITLYAFTLTSFAHASTYTVECVRCFLGSYTFSKDWEENKYIYYDDVYIGQIKYGYNTTLINEDYTHFNADFYTHFASVSNNKGLYKSGDKLKTVWATKEIRHSGSSGQFYIGTIKQFEDNVNRFDFTVK